MNTDATVPIHLLTRLDGHTPDRRPLSGTEIDVLRALHANAHAIRRGHHVVTQGRHCAGLWLLAEGFALRYKLLADGKRQVLHIALPGDMLGYPACFFDRAQYTVVALTEASICPLNFSELTRTFDSHPRLAMALFRLGAGETMMYSEHLASVGRRGAIERVAHFVLEMAYRLQAVGIGDGTEFRIPLTQEQIGDVLGLSAPHVNRMLRRLREDGLIDLADSTFRLLDRAGLAELADFDESYLATSGSLEHAALPGGATYAGRIDPGSSPQ